jgi:hypothetical protein
MGIFRRLMAPLAILQALQGVLSAIALIGNDLIALGLSVR